MKKIYLMLMLIAMLFTTGVNAQETKALRTSGLLDNWYVGGQIGANTPLSFQNTFPLNTTAGIFVGKNITPILGLEIEGNVWFGDNGAFKSSFTHPLSAFPSDVFDQILLGQRQVVNQHFAGRTFVTAMTLGANATVNWSNLIFGYNGKPRAFEVSTVAGLAWQHIYGKNEGNYSNQYKNESVILKTGARASLYINKERSLKLFAEPDVLWNLSEPYQGYNKRLSSAFLQMNKKTAYLSLSVGVVYNFKNKGGKHYFELYNISDMNSRIDSLRAALAVKPDTVTVTNTDSVVVNPYVVKFAKNSAELSDEATATLDSVPAQASVDLKGTASPEGKASYNKTLSQKRVDAVKAYLEKRGINVQQVDAVGAEDGKTSNRLVYVTVLNVD